MHVPALVAPSARTHSHAAVAGRKNCEIRSTARLIIGQIEKNGQRRRPDKGTYITATPVHTSRTRLEHIN